ncbi:hypothetical protein Moror_6287 [Moniliophthora roreri MCA 2997]|uniref:Uncharacterized protein n=2 Tax=Moniliophthora roreri TaxID=221103 RepID=V2XW13_MONRO|nr:hypothetical protein Moror_6287 [Moniliophthora roreri MCA 2997]
MSLMKHVDDSKFVGECEQSYLLSFREHVAGFEKHLLGSGDRSLLPSRVATSSYWTSSEKETFFHSLSVHSRYRPDLIALDIKSKSIADVCVYLTLLEKAAAEAEPINRGKFSIAMTVSDSWVRVEEEQAKGILDSQDTPEGGRVRYETSVQEIEAYRSGIELDQAVSREKLMSRLSEHHLNVMDVLLDGHTQPVTEPQLESMDIPHSSPGVAHTQPRSPERSPDTLVAQQDSAIHPSTHQQDSSPEFQPPDSANLSPASRRRFRKRLYMRRKRAAQTGGIVSLDPAILPRGKKSRGGVAQREAREATQDIDVKHDTNAQSSAVPQDALLREEVGMNVTESTTPTLSKEEIVKNEWEALGIDAQTLVSNDLGLFHLESLGHFMGLFRYTSSEDVCGDTTSSISAKTIQSLQCLVRAFVLDVVHHTIVLKEEERRLKSQTKVWNTGNDEISLATINHALALVGYTGSGKRKLFSKLQRRAKPEPQDSESSAGDDSDVPDSHDYKIETYTSVFTPVPALSRVSAHGHFEMDLDEEILSTENEEQLLMELEEEKKLDANDCVLEAQYEEQLWK